MSSTEQRRMRRRMEQDIKKGRRKRRDIESDYIPTVEEVKEYINNKIKEQNVQLQEETGTDTTTN